MSDLICRKTMRPCMTPGMCAPFQGCGSRAHIARTAIEGVPMPTNADRIATLERELRVTNEALDMQRARSDGFERERDEARAEVERLNATLDKIIAEPNETWSNTKALWEIIRLARAARSQPCE